MNVVEGLAYIRAGLLQAGYRQDQVHVGMDLAAPSNTDSVPSAAAYSLVSRFMRSAKRERIPASQLREQVEGAIAGSRRSLMDGFTWFEVTLTHTSMQAAQDALNRFLAYLVTTNLVDQAGKSYAVLSEGGERERELILEWNDHDLQDRVTCTFRLALPGVVWRDHPIIPVDIHVRYRLDNGGQDG